MRSSHPTAELCTFVGAGHVSLSVPDMPNFSISAKAYAKIVLHCCKYPHRAVNGVVIGTFSDKDQGAGVLIQDAVPLFHQNLTLAPMLEVALRQVAELVGFTRHTCRTTQCFYMNT